MLFFVYIIPAKYIPIHLLCRAYVNYSIIFVHFRTFAYIITYISSL
nr:MAG TPA: hypothetical protein [Caudoviricetes sp.]